MINNRLTFIVDRIDQAITDGFYVKAAKYWGLARLEPRQGQTIPMAYKGFGQNDFLFNDNFPMNLYHRVLDESEEPDDEAGFGAKSLITETFSMILVVFGNQRKINDTDEDINYKIADEIKSLIPNKLDQADIRQIEARSSFIATTGQDLDRVAVYGVELPDKDYDLKPETLLFAINYTIEIKYDSDCKTISCEVEAAPKTATVIDNENTNSPILLKLGEKYTCRPATATGTITGATCAELQGDLSFANRQVIQRVNALVSGQTTSYAADDDGDTELGRLVNFFTLDCNNGFGNTNRFTNDAGGQTKDGSGGETIDYILDNATPYGWFVNVPGANLTWATAFVTAAASVAGGFSNWRMPNLPEFRTIQNLEVGNGGINYSPVDISRTLIWTSTTAPASTTRAYAYDRNSNMFPLRTKTTGTNLLLVRNHFA